MSGSEPVPTFYLYGEPQREVAGDFVHVESLDDRSRPSEWTIRPHLHRALNHVILIAKGGGAMRADGQAMQFVAPCLLLIPARVIHGFGWHSESSGWVTTIADVYLRHLLTRDAELGALFQAPQAIAVPQGDAVPIEARIERLHQELGWIGPGQRAAVEALLLDLLVQALRHAAVTARAVTEQDGKAELVARLRERIEQRFRLREPVPIHARALGVSETALRQACARIAHSAPMAMLDERSLLEAQRLLLYSQMSISEIGYAIGFDDPAYFSRFFTRHLGQSPRQWRAQRDQRPGQPVE